MTRYRAIRPQKKLIKILWDDDGVEEEQELVLPPHELTVYEPEDTGTGIYDASGNEIHREREPIGFIRAEEQEEGEE